MQDGTVDTARNTLFPWEPGSLENSVSAKVSSQPSRHKLGWRGLWWVAPGRGKYVSVSLCARAHTSKSWGSSLQGISETSGSGDDSTWEAEMLKPVSQPRRKAFRFTFCTCFQQLTKSPSVQNLTLWHFLYVVLRGCGDHGCLNCLFLWEDPMPAMIALANS